MSEIIKKLRAGSPLSAGNCLLKFDGESKEYVLSGTNDKGLPFERRNKNGKKMLSMFNAFRK